MNNPRATDRWVQTAFLQVEGELCLRARFQHKNAAARSAPLALQGTGGDTRPSSGPPTLRACHTPASPKTIQSP